MVIRQVASPASRPAAHKRAVLRPLQPQRNLWPATSTARSPPPREMRIAELLEFLGRHVIPRRSVRVSLASTGEQREYLLRIQKEHRRIVDAIGKGEACEVRKAMRTHLTRSLRRYRRLAERQLAVIGSGRTAGDAARGSEGPGK